MTIPSSDIYQITAASGSCSGSNGCTITASCNTGDLALSGGFNNPGSIDDSVIVFKSQPNGNNAWQCRVYSDASGVTCYVKCLDVV